MLLYSYCLSEQLYVAKLLPGQLKKGRLSPILIVHVLWHFYAWRWLLQQETVCFKLSNNHFTVIKWIWMHYDPYVAGMRFCTL